MWTAVNYQWNDMPDIIADWNTFRVICVKTATPKWLLSAEGKHHFIWPFTPVITRRKSPVVQGLYLTICYLEGIEYVDLEVQPDKTWKEVRSVCDNYGGGGYTLPLPDSLEYHNALVTLGAGNGVALGFSDEAQEGNFVNVYTGTKL